MLEDAIKELTAAVKEQTETLKAFMSKSAEHLDVKNVKVPKEPSVKPNPEYDPSVKVESKKTPKVEEEDAAQDVELDYGMVRNAIIMLKRQEAVGLLKFFGVEKIGELKQDQWPEAYTAALAVKEKARSFVS